MLAMEFAIYPEVLLLVIMLFCLLTIFFKHYIFIIEDLSGKKFSNWSDVGF